jgi:hypothetical protein
MSHYDELYVEFAVRDRLRDLEREVSGRRALPRPQPANPLAGQVARFLRRAADRVESLGAGGAVYGVVDR